MTNLVNGGCISQGKDVCRALDHQMPVHLEGAPVTIGISLIMSGLDLSGDVHFCLPECQLRHAVSAQAQGLSQTLRSSNIHYPVAAHCHVLG